MNFGTYLLFFQLNVHFIYIISYSGMNCYYALLLQRVLISVISNIRSPKSSEFIMSKEEKKKKQVLIVGAGASGTAAAYALSKVDDKFDVQVWEAAQQAGGVATSEKIDGRPQV